MSNVYLVQIPFQLYAESTFVYFPYSVGLLWSYAQTFTIVKENFSLKEIVFLKEKPEDILNRLDNPKVVGLSCYMWNMNYTMNLAKLIKTAYPDCLIIAGGPSVPVLDDNFLNEHPYLDILVYREGEVTFANILRALAAKEDLNTVGGIAFRKNGVPYRTTSAVRVDNLNDIPSPYLLGLFDNIVTKAKDHKVIFNGIIETNRGCPFSCTFCDWGNGTLGKVKKFDLTRVKKELLWLAKNKVEYITNCDANFGIYKERDMEICRFMTRLKRRYGYPQTFDTNWHKNNDGSIVTMAKHLLEHKMLRRFTSSMQSGNTITLQAIKRRNLSDASVREIIKVAQENNITTRTELIIGLPEETYESFQLAYVSVIEQGLMPNASPLQILPNSEMAEKEYRKRYGLKTQFVKQNYAFTDEVEEIVIETNTMKAHELERLILWVWFIQQFHFCGYTNVIYDYFKKTRGYNLAVFYEKLLDLMLLDNDRLPNQILRPFHNHMTNGTTARLTFGEINQPMHDRMGWHERKKFYHDLKQIVTAMLDDDVALVDDIVQLQDFNQASMDREQAEAFDLSTNLYDFIYGDKPLVYETTRYLVEHDGIDLSIFSSFGEFVVRRRFEREWRTRITPCTLELPLAQ